MQALWERKSVSWIVDQDMRIAKTGWWKNISIKKTAALRWYGGGSRVALVLPDFLKNIRVIKQCNALVKDECLCTDFRVESATSVL